MWSRMENTAPFALVEVCYNRSMSKILIIGNVLKDVYLKLDDRRNEFEKDEWDISWLELGFNGEAHEFFRRTSVYGGAAVTLSVMAHLGVDAKILNSQTEFKNGEMLWQDEPAGYRYIFCHDGGITYFVPSSRKVTDWAMPKGSPEWILVDRSTVISAKLVDELKNFLKFSPTTKLAVHAEKHRSPAGERLAEMADILFVEDEPPMHREEKIVDKIELDKPNEQLVCHISPRKIVMGDVEESWCLSRADMVTHLTVYSTIVATILGVISVGGSVADAVLWAKINAEQATLESSLSARKLQELARAEREKRANVKLVAKSLMASRRGVLAADESDKTLAERLADFGILATAKSRRAYREMLLTTPQLDSYVSGVILTRETAEQKIKGQTYVEYLTNRGIIPGVKADLGQVQLQGTEETTTLGIEGLTERLSEAYRKGVRFAKWHMLFRVGKDMPSFVAVEKNAEMAANFAKECQLAGLVPMVESDVSYDGDYNVERSVEVTNRVLTTVFEKLEQRRVDFSGCILKTSMVMAAKDAVAPTTPREVGYATAAILRHAVPRRLAGVLFLSGGLEPKVATQDLMEVRKNGPFEWPISFAFGRALQDPVMMTWKGHDDGAAQAALKRKLEDNIAALG